REASGGFVFLGLFGHGAVDRLRVGEGVSRVRLHGLGQFVAPLRQIEEVRRDVVREVVQHLLGRKVFPALNQQDRVPEILLRFRLAVLVILVRFAFESGQFTFGWIDDGRYARRGLGWFRAGVGLCEQALRAIVVGFLRDRRVDPGERRLAVL